MFGYHLIFVFPILNNWCLDMPVAEGRAGLFVIEIANSFGGSHINTA